MKNRVNSTCSHHLQRGSRLRKYFISVPSDPRFFISKKLVRNIGLHINSPGYFKKFLDRNIKSYNLTMALDSGSYYSNVGHIIRPEICFPVSKLTQVLPFVFSL